MALLARVKHCSLALLWDTSISDTGAIISVPNDTISPHLGAAFPEICLAFSRRASPQRAEIPKLVSPAYYSWQELAPLSDSTSKEGIDRLSFLWEGRGVYEGLLSPALICLPRLFQEHAHSDEEGDLLLPVESVQGPEVGGTRLIVRQGNHDNGIECDPHSIDPIGCIRVNA